MKKSTEDGLIQSIAAGHDEKIVEVYDQYKKQFVNWAQRNHKLSEEDALDIFQDTIVVFYKKIRSHQLQSVEHTIRTYLYSIAKNIMLNNFRDKERHHLPVENFDEFGHPGQSEENEHLEDIRHRVRNLMSKIGNPCYQLLKLYYYDGYSMEAIAREIGSKNANVVKAQKARCINELKRMIERHKERIK